MTSKGFPRLYAAASLKLVRPVVTERGYVSFPRLYAAASLKQQVDVQAGRHQAGFPRLYAAASLKRHDHPALQKQGAGVFRGFMPRPH